ncbi:MAG TPA: glycosyltransferase family 2 protein [Gemmatimonadales bacterium]
MPEHADGRLAVIIPAYQAAKTLPGVVERTRQSVADAHVYVVDDGSTDGTGEGRWGTGVTVLRHERNRGKGAALASGIARALVLGAGAIVTLDADGQHPPELIPGLVGPIARGEADLVLGARARSAAMPLGRRVNNWLSAALTSRVGGQLVVDAQTGFRAFTRTVAEAIRPSETSYDYEAAFLLGVVDRGFRVRSVPIPTIYDGAASHFRHWLDTWRLARVFVRYSRPILLGRR